LIIKEGIRTRPEKCYKRCENALGKPFKGDEADSYHLEKMIERMKEIAGKLKEKGVDVSEHFLT
jgi:hypothetical protein